MSRHSARTRKAEQSVRPAKASQTVIVERATEEVVPVGEERIALYTGLAAHEVKARGLPPTSQMVILPAKAPDAASWARMVQQEAPAYEQYQQRRLREIAKLPPQEEP